MGHLGMNLTRNGLIVLISVIFVAGAGTAYAGIVLPMITLAGDVTITGDMTCPGCVDSADIADGTITGADIADGTISSRDITAGTINSAEIKDGTIQLDDLSPELRVLLGLGTCPNTSSLGFVYQGQVTSVTDSSNFLGGGINVGEMIKGVYCYAPNTPDTFGSAQIGSYSLEFYSISIGNDDFVCSDNMGLAILVDVGGRDGYDVNCGGMSSTLFSIVPISEGTMSLSDTDQTIFVDDSLPQSAPDFNEFETKTFLWFFDNDSEITGGVEGIITSLIQIQ